MFLNSIYSVFIKRFKFLKKKDFFIFFIILQKIYLLKKNVKKKTLKKKKKNKNKKRNFVKKKNLKKKLKKKTLKKKSLNKKNINKKRRLSKKKKINNNKLALSSLTYKKKLIIYKLKQYVKKFKINLKVVKVFYCHNYKLKRVLFTKLNPYYIFLSCLDNIKPALVLKARLIRGRLNKIPFIIKRNNDYKQVFNWLKECWKEQKKKESYFIKYVLKEFGIIYNTKSQIFKKRVSLYAEIMQNRSSLRFLKKRKRKIN